MNPRIPDDLKYARAEHDSPYGLIVSDWKRDGQTFTWNITVPTNTTATIYIPAKSAKDIDESGEPINKATGVKFLQMQNDRAVINIDSGCYKFISKTK